MIAAVVERCCIVRIKPDHLAEILDGAVVLASVVVGEAAVVDRVA